MQKNGLSRSGHFNLAWRTCHLNTNTAEIKRIPLQNTRGHSCEQHIFHVIPLRSLYKKPQTHHNFSSHNFLPLPLFKTIVAIDNRCCEQRHYLRRLLAVVKATNSVTSLILIWCLIIISSFHEEEIFLELHITLCKLLLCGYGIRNLYNNMSFKVQRYHT